jgi:hypothetical protein
MGTKKPNVVFLCYEKDSFCHRHIASNFLSQKFGIKISEFGKELPKEEPEETYEQLSLFDMQK